MHRDHKTFIQAIEDSKKVVIKHRNNAGRKERTKICRPLFYIPVGGQNDSAHYYFWDSEKGETGNIFWATPAQIISMEPTQESFEPSGFTLVRGEELSERDSQSSDSLEHSQ